MSEDRTNDILKHRNAMVDWLNLKLDQRDKIGHAKSNLNQASWLGPSLKLAEYIIKKGHRFFIQTVSLQHLVYLIYLCA